MNRHPDKNPDNLEAAASEDKHNNKHTQIIQITHTTETTSDNQTYDNQTNQKVTYNYQTK